ncbi:MAG TPA: 6-carboxyhexanoate--CoA ligase [Dissulfurispiraceae bacterium]|nr:6-carboxyhexanoate--CoA ligase [Dissulfurispiraceae bacterium]
MRASAKDMLGRTGKHGSPANEIHISGAEGICEDSEISGLAGTFISRALSHTRGTPDKIIITLERMKDLPKQISLLPVRTLECEDAEDAWRMLAACLSKLGISSAALRSARRVLKAKRTMRGAALISLTSGKRLEPDRARGVRVSRLGIEKTSEKRLVRKLSRMGINSQTVREALVLASKVSVCREIVAEICISDDPDYATGYIASRSFGYLRIPNIKRPGEMHGGRVFFLKENSDVKKTIDWLERKPVIAGKP